MKRLWTALLLCFACAGQAQDYPSKPIRILVPFAPGGAVDTSARVLTQAMTQRLAKTAADGYTLLMAHTGEFAVNPALFSDVPSPTLAQPDVQKRFVDTGAKAIGYRRVVEQAGVKPG